MSSCNGVGGLLPRQVFREIFDVPSDLSTEGGAWFPGLQPQRFRTVGVDALRKIGQYAQPRALWRCCPLVSRGHALAAEGEAGEAVLLETVGMPKEFTGSSWVVFLAVTLGPLKEAKPGALAEDLLEQYALLGAGMELLNKIHHEAWSRIRAVLQARGVDVGSSVAPGEGSSWPLEGQRALGALLNLPSIGVALNECQVLDPVLSCTSAAAVFPLGDPRTAGGGEPGAPCRRCARSETCGWRHPLFPEERGSVP